MLLATALALLITGCSTILFQQTSSSSTGKPSPIISSFLELGRRKLSMQPKFVAAQKMLLETETQQTFVNGLLGLLLRHLYSAGSACVLLTIIAWVAHRYGQLYLHCSLIYFWVPSSCFCIVISLSIEGEIIPFSECLPVGGRLHYPRRRR